MGVGGSLHEFASDWNFDTSSPSLYGVHVLGQTLFTGKYSEDEEEIASFTSFAQSFSSPECFTDALVERGAFAAGIGSSDEGSLETIFNVMTTDPAGRRVNVYEVLSCAVLLSPHLPKMAKIVVLCGLWSTHEDGRLSVGASAGMIEATLRGFHRLSLLHPSPPTSEEIENDVCRLLWLIRKTQPCRTDALQVEEILLVAEFDISIAKVLDALCDSSAQLRCATRHVDGLQSNADAFPFKPEGPAKLDGKSGNGKGKRSRIQSRQRSASTASRITAVTASALLSRREVLSAFDVFRTIHAEQARLIARGGEIKHRDLIPLKSVANVKNQLLQAAIKRHICRGQLLEFRDFLRMHIVSKGHADCTGAHLQIFEAWVTERVPLTDSELAKYRLDTPIPQQCPQLGGTACRRRIRALFGRARDPKVRVWLHRVCAAASVNERAMDAAAGDDDFQMTMAELALRNVIPGEMATAALQTFGWIWEHTLVTEGMFLELFVPVPPCDYHSLDFMRVFRKAWLQSRQEAQDLNFDLDAYTSSCAQPAVNCARFRADAKNTGSMAGRPSLLCPLLKEASMANSASDAKSDTKPVATLTNGWLTEKVESKRVSPPDSPAQQSTTSPTRPISAPALCRRSGGKGFLVDQQTTDSVSRGSSPVATAGVDRAAEIYQEPNEAWHIADTEVDVPPEELVSECADDEPAAEVPDEDEFLGASFVMI